MTSNFSAASPSHSPSIMTNSTPQVSDSLTPNAETIETFEKSDRDEDILYYDSFEDLKNDILN